MHIQAPRRENKMRAFCLANAGVYLQTGRSALVVDGLYDMQENPAWPVEGLPQEVVSFLLHETSPLSKIEYLIFTHCHEDHFCWELVGQAIRSGRVAWLCLPYDAQRYSPAEVEALCKNHGVGLQFWQAETERIEGPDFTLRAVKTAHLQVGEENIPHYSLVVETASASVLIGGDAQAGQLTALAPTRPGPFNLAFLIFFHLSSRASRQAIQALNPAQCVLYHMPYQEEKTHIRALSEKLLKQYEAELPPLLLPDHALQEIVF